VSRVRFPDKPRLSAPSVLRHLAAGEWVAQVKHDGWRAWVECDRRRAALTSRQGNPIAAFPTLLGELGSRLAGLPLGTRLDGEWLGRRRFEPREPQDWS
jgi:ATP-dependent DNA ligase